MKRLSLCLLACAACTTTTTKVGPKPVVLPEGFVVRRTKPLEDAFLAPDAAWRQLLSRLTTMQVDARRTGDSILVTLWPDRILVTDPTGLRHGWRLPDGLSLSVVHPHVVLGADLSLVAFSEEASQVEAEEELTLAVARVAESAESSREFRLVIKGGKAFRSMTSG